MGYDILLTDNHIYIDIISFIYLAYFSKVTFLFGKLATPLFEELI